MKYIYKINVLLLFFFLVVTAEAQTRLSVQGAGKLYPIAVPQPCAVNVDNDLAREISEVLSRDLDLSGFFEVLNPAAFIEAAGKCGDPKNFAYTDWTVLGVDGLVRGQLEELPGGLLALRLYLFDVQVQKLQLAKEYTGEEAQLRSMAHKFANEIMKYFTGEFGPFGTRIVYSGRIGRFKELFIMDLDGSNLRQLTSENSLAVSAAWDKSATRVIFTNFKKRLPDIFVIRPGERYSTRITENLPAEIGPKFSRSGNILTALSAGSKSDIVELSDAGVLRRKLTFSYVNIDVSPDYSPDESQIAFVSNRSGGPQVYVMNADGTGAHRVSYVNSNYCTSPVWSPKGSKLAFVCRSENRHNIFVTNVDGSNPVQLTVAGSNEDPSWSPDGRYLVFASNFGGDPVYNLAIIRVDGSNLRQITKTRAGSYDPAWSGWGY